MPPTETAETDGLVEVDQIGEPEAQAAPLSDDKPPAKPKDDDELTTLRRQLRDEQRSRREFQKAAEHWAHMAQASPKPAAPAAPTPEPEPKITVDLVDALTNGDHKGVRQALREMGFVSQEEVNRTIAETRAQITRETQILQQYPELANEGSEFFKRTGQVYNELASDPSLKNSPRLVEMAARIAKAELGTGDDTRTTRRRTAREPEPEPDEADFEELEEERAARISRQTGDRGRAPARRDQDQPEELSAMQKTIVRKLQEAGAPIDEEKYRNRATRGVRMGGLPTFRRGRR